MTQKMNLDTKEWEKLFPENVECYSNSLKFMKQLTMIAVSTITYLKCMFPDINYLTEEFYGIELKLLKYKCENIDVQFISQGLLNAYDAIDKKYLQKMELCFYKDADCTRKNLFESFWFQFNYIDNEVSLYTKNANNQKIKKYITLKDIQFATINMIQRCIIVSHCSEKLPENFEYAILLYYNDDAPRDYHAPGYMPDDDDNLVKSSDKICLGIVKTRFHELVAWTCFNYVQDGTNEAIAVQDKIMQKEKSMKRKTAVNGNEKCGVNNKKIKIATK